MTATRGAAIEQFPTAEEKHLAQMEGRYRGLLEAAPDAMVVVDDQGEIVLVNVQAEKQFGYRRDELLGQKVTNVIPEGFAERIIADGTRTAAEALAQQIGTGIELSALRKDGTEFPIEIMLIPLESAKGILVTAAIRDISVRTAAEKHLAQVEDKRRLVEDALRESERKLLRAQLEQSDRVSSLGRLAATMAHEFNNVLMGIQPFAELLLRQSPGEAVQRATQNILQAVQRGRSITHGILSFANPAAPVKERIDVAEWLRSMETSMSAVLGDNIRMNLRVDGEALIVRGDRHQLEQVLTNLAANARDAMRGSGTFSVLLERCVRDCVSPFGALRTSDQHIHLRISDTGCGVDATMLKSIFDPFFTTKRSGTGLGLAVAHQVMQLHGGGIVAESVPGEGTTFHLVLPFCEDASEETVTRPALVQRTSVESILMIEDDETVSSGVADLLRDEGLRVDVAATGVAALAALELHVPDAVILDAGLPDIDGRLLYERMAVDHPDIAIVFASGSSDEEMLRPSLKSEQPASLTKPYEFSALLEILATLNVPHGRPICESCS